MGKHSEQAPEVWAPRTESVTVVAQPSSTPRIRGRYHGNVPLSIFGFLAAFAFILVNVTDPYAGATASPYYHAASDTVAPQLLELADDYEPTAVTRDNFGVTEKPVVVAAPVPVAEVESSDDDSAESWAPPVAVADPGSAQSIAASMVAARGWPSSEFDCLFALWNKESGWRVNAYNASSGAYGIPQSLPGSKMASVGSDWETNPATQIEWGLGYITSRYGTPCGAWQSSVDRGWY